MTGALGGAATLIQHHSAGRHHRRAKRRGSGNGENSLSHRILPTRQNE
jgi:hypothetical protein